MFDVPTLIAGLVLAVRQADFPDASSIASLLHLDISQATITRTKQGRLGINGARLEGTIEAGLAGGVTPRRELNLVFPDSKVLYGSLEGQIFGDDQRIQNSKFGPGLAVLFKVDGLNCGLTASAPDGVVQCLFCEEPNGR